MARLKSQETGKVSCETHPRPLAWGDTKYAMDKICTIHMVGAGPDASRVHPCKSDHEADGFNI